MNSADEAKWHWAEGMKFALEGFKLLFILNGAASISILTFIGKADSTTKCNGNSGDRWMGWGSIQEA